MTIRSLSPPSKASALRVKHAIGVGAFKAAIPIPEESLREWAYMYWWMPYIMDLVQGELAAALNADPSHWWGHPLSDAERTRRFLDVVLTRARTELPA